jgi:hypothetical protein
VNSQSGNTAFTVTSNTDWNVTSDAAWCTVTGAGSGDGTIVADFTQNTADQPRVANIQVTVASLPVQTVTVTQAKSSIGIGEEPGQAVGIYPNPTKGIFKIVPGHAVSGVMDVTVQDLAGKVILRKQCKGEKEYEIDLSAAPQGTYHIIIKTDANLVVKKLAVIR